jgi:SAM-dependent methyltransferase
MSGGIVFDNGAAYERFMGCWSRAVGSLFLDWLAPPENLRWLEIGCGTGAFTSLALDKCVPAAMVATDPAASQIEYACRQRLGERAHFGAADATTLPFPDCRFDIVVSALVVNFISEPCRAIREMRRVGCAGATVAGYVWDFANGRTPNSPLTQGLRRIGIDAPPVPGAEHSSCKALRKLFDAAGLREIDTIAIDIPVTFSDFTTFWQAQTPSFSPTTRIIASLAEEKRAELVASLRSELPVAPDGRIAYQARANAIKARVPY